MSRPVLAFVVGVIGLSVVMLSFIFAINAWASWVMAS